MQRVGAALESLLLEQMLKPMSAGDDALGDYGLSAVARVIAERDTHGFGALIAARLDGHLR
jgi:hypothetical protein